MAPSVYSLMGEFIGVTKMKNILLRIGYLLSGIRSIRGYNLGDKVKGINEGYEGRAFYLMNGPSAPSWSVQEEGKGYTGNLFIHEKHFKKEHSIKGSVDNVMARYGFLVGYWLDIHLRKFSYRDIFYLFFPVKKIKQIINYSLTDDN